MFGRVRPPSFFYLWKPEAETRQARSTSLIERVAKAGAACYGSGEAEVTLS